MSNTVEFLRVVKNDYELMIHAIAHSCDIGQISREEYMRKKIEILDKQSAIDALIGAFSE